MIQMILPHDHGQNVERVLELLPSEEAAGRVADVYKTLGDASRLRVFWLLCHCEECVGNIASACSLSPQAVSHHLSILRKAGLVQKRRDGKEIYYRTADGRMAELAHRVCEEIFEITCPAEN